MLLLSPRAGLTIGLVMPTQSSNTRGMHSSSRIGGVSAWSHELRQVVRRIAQFDSSVLITGPTGSGKGLIAQSIHDGSPRANRPFILVNCATICNGLSASQLFGHERGAFTGAAGPILGCFRAADGGTIVLDEIGELEPSLQARILTTLEARNVTPLGSDRSVPIDVRIIAATNRNLSDDVGQGLFRRDLYFRLRIVEIRTEPLRNHPEDIADLADRALAALTDTRGFPRKRLAPAALIYLEGLDWPGNVRQLQNMLEQAAVFSDGEQIGESLLRSLYEFRELGEEVDEPPQARTLSSAGQFCTLAAMERQHIVAALARAADNKAAAARLLGISRQSLLRRIEKLGLVDRC